ncbi:MAG: substrate-binding domain-containing protein [Thermoguttaceae bacterium]
MTVWSNRERVDMCKPYRIALLIESSRAYGRQLLRGIAAFAQQHGNWTFFHEERSLGDSVPTRLKQWKPDGIIARLASSRQIRQIRRLQVPVVDLFHEDALKAISGIAVDQNALVEMAFSHFLERGFRTFAYCGFASVLFSQLRESRFVSRLAGQGYAVDVFRYPPPVNPDGLATIEAHAMRYSSRLAQWLKELPKPVGLFACNDMRGQQVLAVCNEAGIAVPDEVAVLGVDNDDVQCELSNPPLSSIDPNAQAIGYEAARLLQRLLDGRAAPCKKIVIEPSRVVIRQSTDVLAIADRHVAKAVEFVRMHACDGMDADVVVAQMKISRSTLERWYRSTLGHSLTDEIMRVRVNRAAELLTTTHLKIEAIAHMTGFTHVETMSRIFKRSRGLAPGQYRLKFKMEQGNGF